jgi:hypothetical protein
MGQERGVAVRPAGAPMVSAERPSWARPDDNAGSGATSEVAQQARQAGQEVVYEARQAAGQVAAEAKDAGQQMAGDARRAAEEQINQRSTMAGERVGLAAEDARDVAQTLRGKGREAPAKVADQAADRMERFAQYLRDADAGRIMYDIRRVGREQPAAVVAGAAVVGVIIGRVVKASDTSGSTSGARPNSTSGSATQLPEGVR